MNVLSLFKEHEDVRKSFNMAVGQEEKRQRYVHSLDNLFDIASPKAVEMLQKNRLLGNKEKDEDLCFLEDQRKQRLGYMSNRDKLYDKSVERKNSREMLLSKQKSKELDRVEEKTSFTYDENIEDTMEIEDADEFTLPETKRREKLDIMGPVSQVAD